MTKFKYGEIKSKPCATFEAKIIMPPSSNIGVGAYFFLSSLSFCLKLTSEQSARALILHMSIPKDKAFQWPWLNFFYYRTLTFEFDLLFKNFNLANNS